MFQPISENNPNRQSESQGGKLDFVVGDPAEVQPGAARPDGSRHPGVDDDNKWVSDRLTACYND
jgi:hypothetical protein